ncbi:MAG: DUF2269 domain-containing protein [Hyphomicrobiales bacterium]|nr:DUF2269 domain-containing protein [Hyphomicrobiales bacterium]
MSVDPYLALRVLHILGAAVLFGTGLGIAFFMFMAHRSGDPAVIAGTARTVVVADFIFTATAVVAQPVTGTALVFVAGHSFSDLWVHASLGLYVLTGLCWLPVVVLQMRMRRLAEAAAEAGTPLPADYHRLFRIWFFLGWPAFAAVMAIFVLMVFKPV